MENKIRLITSKTKLKLDKLKILQISIKSLIFIISWSIKFKIKLTLSFKLKLSTFIAIIFQQYYSDQAMKVFFSGISIQRYWDNLYDNHSTKVDFLHGLKTDVFDENYLSTKPLVVAYFDLINILENKFTDISKLLIIEFKEEFHKIIDAYEYESSLSTRNIDSFNNTDLENYKFYSTNSVALKYTFLLLGISLIKSEEDYKEFITTFEIADQAAWAIRLANDISGHERELAEEKKDYITIMTSVNKISETEAINIMLDEIDVSIKKISALNDTRFNVILSRIVFLAINRYLNNNFE